MTGSKAPTVAKEAGTEAPAAPKGKFQLRDDVKMEASKAPTAPKPEPGSQAPVAPKVVAGSKAPTGAKEAGSEAPAAPKGKYHL